MKTTVLLASSCLLVLPIGAGVALAAPVTTAAAATDEAQTSEIDLEIEGMR